MAQLNDAMFDYLRGQGYQGAMPDMRYAFFQAQGVSTWREFYTVNGGTGQLNDWLLQYFEGGAVVGRLPSNCIMNSGSLGNRIGYRLGLYGGLVPHVGPEATITRLRWSPQADGRIEMRAEDNVTGDPETDQFEFTTMTLDGNTYLAADADFRASFGRWRWPAQSTLVDGAIYPVTFT